MTMSAVAVLVKNNPNNVIKQCEDSNAVGFHLVSGMHTSIHDPGRILVDLDEFAFKEFAGFDEKDIGSASLSPCYSLDRAGVPLNTKQTNNVHVVRFHRDDIFFVDSVGIVGVKFRACFVPTLYQDLLDMRFPMTSMRLSSINFVSSFDMPLLTIRSARDVIPSLFSVLEVQQNSFSVMTCTQVFALVAKLRYDESRGIQLVATNVDGFEAVEPVKESDSTHVVNNCEQLKCGRSKPVSDTLDEDAGLRIKMQKHLKMKIKMKKGPTSSSVYDFKLLLYFYLLCSCFVTSDAEVWLNEMNLTLCCSTPVQNLYISESSAVHENLTPNHSDPKYSDGCLTVELESMGPSCYCFHDLSREPSEVHELCLRSDCTEETSSSWSSEGCQLNISNAEISCPDDHLMKHSTKTCCTWKPTVDDKIVEGSESLPSTTSPSKSSHLPKVLPLSLIMVEVFRTHHLTLFTWRPSILF